MAAPIASLLYGPETLLVSESVDLRADGLDEVQLGFISSNDSLIETDDNVPGYSGFKIQSISKAKSKSDWSYRVTAVGLLESKGSRRDPGYPKITVNLEGLDEATDSWISSSSDFIEQGDTLDGYSKMYCLSVTREELLDDFYRWTARYGGIVASKPYKRTISVNGQTVSSDRLVVDLPGGWTTPAKGQGSFPKIVVSDFHVFDGAPPTEDIPGNATPPDPPDTSSIAFSGEVIKLWPNGWSFVGIEGGYIAGTSIWSGNYVYEYVISPIPG